MNATTLDKRQVRKRLMKGWRNLPPAERAAFYREEIVPFNRKNPENMITFANLLRSFSEQRRRESLTRSGAYIQKMQSRQTGRAYAD